MSDKSANGFNHVHDDDHLHGDERDRAHNDDHGRHDHDHRDSGAHSGHSHAPASFGRAFAIGVSLNLGFVLVESGYGWFAHSLSLVADAGHNLSDVFGLLLAWGAVFWAKRPPTTRHTYGWRRSSVLAALGNATFLLISVGVIAWEAVRRLQDPTPVSAPTVIWVAALGIVINGSTALLFMRGRKGDLNVRGAYLHMMADALVSAGVVVAGIVMSVTDWRWLDPVVSLVLTAVITVGTWGLLRDSFNLALDAVPTGIDLENVQAYLCGVPGVVSAHHVHIWGLSTSESALTAHLVLSEETVDNALLSTVHRELREKFGIGHATIQLETARQPACIGADCHPTEK